MLISAPYILVLCSALAFNSYALYVFIQRLRLRNKSTNRNIYTPTASDLGTEEENVKLVVVPTEETRNGNDDLGCSKIPGSSYLMVGRVMKQEDKKI